MKRIIAALLLALLAVPGYAMLGWRSVSATETSQTIVVASSGVPSGKLLLKNMGANEVYIQTFYGSETTRAATTSDIQIDANDGWWTFEGVSAISIKCDTGETATVRLIWQQ